MRRGTNLCLSFFVFIGEKEDVLMKNKTLRVIIILVGLLVLNIEAAQAGITHKFKVLIANELSDFQLMYVSGGLLFVAFFSYVIFTPAFKEQGRRSSLAATYMESYTRERYRVRRDRIRKISEILHNTVPENKAHS